MSQRMHESTNPFDQLDADRRADGASDGGGGRIAAARERVGRLNATARRAMQSIGSVDSARFTSDNVQPGGQ